LKDAVLVDLGCGTGLGVLYAWLCGIRKIRASDIQGKLVKTTVNHYEEQYSVESDPYRPLKSQLPKPNEFKKLFVNYDVNTVNAR